VYSNEQEDVASIEKGSSGHGKQSGEKYTGADYVVIADDKFKFNASELDRVQRKLQQRHVQMIAIAGTIGTGLFLGSGETLSTGGPVGALIAYALVGSVAYASLAALGEVTSHAPISGTFPHFAARWVDPALGFAVGWNYFYANAMTLPAEITAATLLLTFWDSNVNHQPIYIAVMIVCCVGINLFGVRYFGESEFVFSCIKLMLITGLIIGGLAVSLGGGPNHDRIGFRFWKHPGPFNEFILPGGTGRFLAVLRVIVQAAFSYQGLELVAVAASETVNPRRNISKAVKRVFYRIVFFYLVGVLITGMLVAYDDPNLLQQTGTAAQSPYVIAFNNAGVKVLPHVINGAVFTSAFSAGNSFLFASSRILYGLALRGQAPIIFARCTKKGLPYTSILFTALFAFLAFLSVSKTASQVFNWLQALTTTGGFFAWLTMNITFLRFYYGCRAQGIDRKKFAYWNPLQPWLSYWGVFWIVIFILTTGFYTFFPGRFNASDFLTSYLCIPIFGGLYFGYKIVYRTRIWKTNEMDFWTGIPSVEETEGDYVPPSTFWAKVVDKVV